MPPPAVGAANELQGNRVESKPVAPNPRTILYVAGFLGLQVFLLMLVMVLASTPWFLTHDGYAGMLQSGYSTRLKNANCDIVLYGDSSALTGLDPDVIGAMTGMKACNISEGVTIQGVVGSRFPLDSYLSHNTRPRYLLTMYTPSVFRPYIEPFDDYQPEGVLYLLQYDRSREMLTGLLRRRTWVVNFDLWAGHQVVADFLSRLPGRHSKVRVDARAQRDGRHGIWPYPVPPETKCVRTAYHLDPNQLERYADSVEEMRRIYAVEGTTVLINMSPLPTCDTLQQAYERTNEGLHDNAFETIPISYFNDGDVHFSPVGAQHVSVEAANQILAIEEQRRGARQTVMSGMAGNPK